MTRLNPQARTVSLAVTATLLGVSRSTIERAARTGEIAPGVPVLQVGGRRLVARVDLERILGPLDDVLNDLAGAGPSGKSGRAPAALAVHRGDGAA